MPLPAQMPQDERLAEHEREGRAQSRRLALAGSLSPAQPRAEQQEERGEKQPVARIARETEDDLVDVRKPRYAAYKAPIAVPEQAQHVERCRDAEARASAH